MQGLDGLDSCALVQLKVEASPAAQKRQEISLMDGWWCAVITETTRIITVRTGCGR